jgi:hypothetical protein
VRAAAARVLAGEGSPYQSARALLEESLR